MPGKPLDVRVLLVLLPCLALPAFAQSRPPDSPTSGESLSPPPPPPAVSPEEPAPAPSKVAPPQASPSTRAAPPSGVSAADAALQPPQPPGFHAARFALELVVGAGAEFVGYALGSALTPVVGAPLGASAAALAIFGIGQLVGGNGNLGWTFAGMGAGFAVGLGLAVGAVLAYAGSLTEGSTVSPLASGLLIAAFACPVVGGALGYELSQAWTPFKPPPRSPPVSNGPQVAPAFALVPGGGLLGLAGSF